MRLINKRTGDVVTALISAYGISGDVAVSVMDSNAESGYKDLGRYKTLAELNNEWKDYTPKEPLIKEEKIRKIIREWSELNVISEIVYSERKDGSLCIFTDYGIDDTSIEFVGWIPTLKDGEEYTIDELCGEDE